MSATISEAEHRLRGTRLTRAVQRDAQFQAGRPKMPKDMPEAAQAAWKRLFKLLRQRGTLTAADAPAMELYSRAWARWSAYDAEATARPMLTITWQGKDGIEHEKVVVNPAAKEAAKLDTALRHMLKEFSATPATRERTKPAQPKPEKPTEDNPLGIVYEE